MEGVSWIFDTIRWPKKMYGGNHSTCSRSIDTKCISCNKMLSNQSTTTISKFDANLIKFIFVFSNYPNFWMISILFTFYFIQASIKSYADKDSTDSKQMREDLAKGVIVSLEECRDNVMKVHRNSTINCNNSCSKENINNNDAIQCNRCKYYIWFFLQN